MFKTKAKGLAALGVAGLLALTLAACGDDDDSGSGGGAAAVKAAATKPRSA